MTDVKTRNATNILNGVYSNSWWVGRCRLCGGAMGNNLGYLGKWLTFLLEWRNQGGEILIIPTSN
jgi:hypothetical protein